MLMIREGWLVTNFLGGHVLTLLVVKSGFCTSDLEQVAGVPQEVWRGIELFFFEIFKCSQVFGRGQT